MIQIYLKQGKECTVRQNNQFRIARINTLQGRSWSFYLFLRGYYIWFKRLNPSFRTELLDKSRHTCTYEIGEAESILHQLGHILLTFKTGSCSHATVIWIYRILQPAWFLCIPVQNGLRILSHIIPIENHM